jgi:hypothetical protein
MALRRQLGERGESAPPDVLGLVTALSELEAVCDGLLDGRGGPNRPNRDSLRDDVSRALGALGKHAAKACGEVLRAFQKELPRLPSRLDRPQGARALSLSLGPLFEHLREPPVVRAAWRDATETFLQTSSSAEDCELRVRQIVELAELAGVDWDARSSTLESILSDHREALSRLGVDIEASDEDTSGFARLPEARRLELCEERVAEPAPRSAVAVWLVIDNAAVEDGYLNLGSVQLFDQSLWPDAARPGGELERRVEEFTGLPELAGPDARTSFGGLDASEHRLYARVRFDDTPVSTARARAREVMVSLIELANTRTDWKMLDGAMSWRADGGWSGSTFSDPDEAPARSRPVHPVFDRTAEGLTEFDHAFIGRLLAGDVRALEAVDDALWSVAVDRGPGAAQRVVLATRALERVLSHARENAQDSWAKPAARFLRAAWVDYTLRNEMLDAGTVAAPLNRDVSIAHLAVYDEVRAAIWLPATAGKHTFSATGLSSISPKLISVLDDGSIERRVIGEAAAVLDDPNAARVRMKALGWRFDRLLARAERQRNAIVHGTGVHEPVLATVDNFLRVLVLYVAQEAMSRAVTGDEPLAGLERMRSRALLVDERLRSGERPVDVLYDG